MLETIKVESEITDDWCSAESLKKGIKILGGWLEPAKVVVFANKLLAMAKEMDEDKPENKLV